MGAGRIPGSLGLDSPGVDAGTLCRSASPAPGLNGSGATHPSRPDPEIRELHDLSLDLFQMALDLAGIVDPTPVSDGVSALLAMARGLWLDAVISGASMVPYVGDLAKAGKLPRYLKSLKRAVKLAEKSKKAADTLLPGFMKLRQVLDLIPTGVNEAIDRMKNIVERFVRSRSAVKVAHELPDISRRFKFRDPYPIMHGGKKYTVREAEGVLGVPGKIQTHGIPSTTQKAVSAGSGDDAGHLIGKQFGAPGDARNLSRQNWRQNESGGTWHDLEKSWANKLKSGTGVKVKVKEFTPEGADRPLWREIEWEEISPNGMVTKYTSPKYLNTHTADAPHRDGSRTQQGIPPTVDRPQVDNVRHADFANKKKLP